MKRDREFRLKQRERIIKNRKRLMKVTGLQHRNQNQHNRYNKQHPYDCGNAECKLCHGDKIFDIDTAEDKRQNDSYKNQIEDI